jgi:hypothetical protein
MKKSYLTVLIALSCLILPIGILAQTKLNQVELTKQFAGNWKVDAGKDTTVFWQMKSNGDDLECDFKYVTKEKPFVEGKQKWEYDKKSDKYILISATTGLEAGSSALWFISKNKSVIVPVSDTIHPSKALFRLEMEFKSPETFLQTTFANNHILHTDTFNRQQSR